MSTESLDALLHEVAARKASPGGGTVSALSIAFGAALAVMSVRFSLPQAPDQRLRMDAGICESLCAAETRLLEIMQSAHELADEDAQAYEQYLSASRLADRGSDANADTQADAQSKLLRACEVPFLTYCTARDALAILADVVDQSKPNLACDVLVGARLLRAGAQAASLNVAVNTRALEDRAIGDKLQAQLRQHEEDLEASFRKIESSALTMLGV